MLTANTGTTDCVECQLSSTEVVKVQPVELTGRRLGKLDDITEVFVLDGTRSIL